MNVFDTLLTYLLLYVCCTAGVQVLNYEEEFRQLFVLTLAKLQQVHSYNSVTYH